MAALRSGLTGAASTGLLVSGGGHRVYSIRCVGSIGVASTFGCAATGGFRFSSYTVSGLHRRGVGMSSAGMILLHGRHCFSIGGGGNGLCIHGEAKGCECEESEDLLHVFEVAGERCSLQR